MPKVPLQYKGINLIGQNRTSGFLILFIVLGCSGQLSGADTATKEENEAGIQAARFGFNYDDIFASAMKTPEKARAFLFLGSCHIFDGAGAEYYGGDVQTILEKYGDSGFQKILQSLDKRFHEPIYDALAFENRYFEQEELPTFWKAFQVKFPKLSKDMESFFKEDPMSALPGLDVPKQKAKGEAP